jgi:catechol 2,3-dioxygenase-like lactoylglutathione lyase family enzyme
MDSSSPIARVRSIDHIVLTVASIDDTVAWYTKYLGVQHECFDSKDGPRHALVFGSQKINLHQAGAEFEPKAQHVQPGLADLCFITDTCGQGAESSEGRRGAGWGA